jgi:hypothetical protein
VLEQPKIRISLRESEMNNRSLGKWDADEKTYAVWIGGGAVLALIFLLVGYSPPLLWVAVWILIGFALVGESEHKKIMDLKNRMQKLEERLDCLERAS